MFSFLKSIINNESQQQTNQYKVVFMGDGATGKTSYATKLLGMEIQDIYVPTLGVEVHPIVKDNNVLNVWDTAGQEQYGGLRDGYYICADGCIYFHNLEDSKDWELDFRQICENRPIIHVMNKSEIFTEEQKNGMREKYPDIIFMSVFEESNLEEPLDKLIEKLQL